MDCGFRKDSARDAMHSPFAALLRKALSSADALLHVVLHRRKLLPRQARGERSRQRAAARRREFVHGAAVLAATFAAASSGVESDGALDQVRAAATALPVLDPHALPVEHQLVRHHYRRPEGKEGAVQPRGIFLDTGSSRAGDEHRILLRPDSEYAMGIALGD
eukprot:113129-Prymnesium_polylepis.1